MHISKEMIHPELRMAGTLIRAVLPAFTERTFRWSDKLLRTVKKGKCRNKALGFLQEYLKRQDGSSLRLCVYYPKNTPKTTVPGLLWMHGGGYAMGIPEQEEKAIARFIEQSGCVVVSPDYTTSLQAPYPAALDDCYSALLWLQKNGGNYGMRADQLMVGGTSAGGGLAVALCLMAREKKEVSIACQIPLYPMLDDTMSLASAKENDAPLWNSRSNELGWRLYLLDRVGTKGVPATAAPARADDVSALPPACSFVGSIEPFFDETVQYIHRLQSCGIPTHFKVFDGCFHGFDVACANTQIARSATAFLMESFRFATQHYFAPQPTKPR